jgi:hypothetical protein
MIKDLFFPLPEDRSIAHEAVKSKPEVIKDDMDEEICTLNLPMGNAALFSSKNTPICVLETVQYALYVKVSSYTALTALTLFTFCKECCG